MKDTITEQVEIPDGVTVTVENGLCTVSADGTSIQRKLRHPRVSISVKDGAVEFSAPNATQREKRHLYTLRSHLRNMLRGATEGHVYKLKICSGHFPMNVSVSGDKLVVKNFLGEAVPRELALKKDATVKIEGDTIVVNSPYKEVAGQQAADIEQLTRITGRDRRIFQDGLFIIEKDGEALL